jgi:Skp family chaperone for outer membrane proteins
MRFTVLSRKPLFAALVATFLAASLGATPAHAAGKTAVVDMVKVMKETPQTKVLEQNFKNAQEEANKNLDLVDKDIQKLKRELEQLNEQHPDRLKREKIYQQQVANAQFNYEWAMKAAMREYTLGLERIYGAVRGEIGRFAEEQGIDLVLYQTPAIQPLNAGDASDFALKSRLRTVIYASASIDITDAIIARLQGK